MTVSSTEGDRKEQGKALRAAVPRSSHADWAPRADRTDPVEVLISQEADRLPWLVPIRHGRMAVSPFTFYRGAAILMAADLAGSPVSGLPAQICGDAHLSNFGSFASPEREQIFDVNDFDETLPGPWEWDLKRLATSFVLAGNDNAFDDGHIRDVTTESVRAYRKAMARFAAATTLDVWYAHLSMKQIAEAVPKKKDRARVTKSAAKARSKDSLKAMAKLTEQIDDHARIKSQSPLLVPLRELRAEQNPDRLRNDVHESLTRYRESLPDDRKYALETFRVASIALKVGGVGSVGTRCFLVLLEGKGPTDPLFLQVKQATESVLESQLPKSVYPHRGRRVVEGQRLMQAAGDIFLGWSETNSGHQYYWRQYHDMKGSADVARMGPRHMSMYARLCGWTLAHAHARSGDPVAMSGYLGKGDVFDRAITEFAMRYADQNQQDYEAFIEAVSSGRIEAEDD